jgi:hypothetical protein
MHQVGKKERKLKAKTKILKMCLNRKRWQDKREDAKIMNICDKYYEESRENLRTYDHKEKTYSGKKWLKDLESAGKIR